MNGLIQRDIEASLHFKTSLDPNLCVSSFYREIDVANFKGAL